VVCVKHIASVAKRVLISEEKVIYKRRSRGTALSNG
jgi:hypothetical protein